MRCWAIDPMFYGLVKSQITDIQLTQMGCKKLGNQNYCDEIIKEKTEFCLQQNKLNDTQSFPEMISESEPTPDPNGYLIVDAWLNIGITPLHEICIIPGEYRVAASKTLRTNPGGVGYFTCQKDKLIGEPQPWMVIQ